MFCGYVQQRLLLVGPSEHVRHKLAAESRPILSVEVVNSQWERISLWCQESLLLGMRRFSFLSEKLYFLYLLFLKFLFNPHNFSNMKYLTNFNISQEHTYDQHVSTYIKMFYFQSNLNSLLKQRGMFLLIVHNCFDIYSVWGSNISPINILLKSIYKLLTWKALYTYDSSSHHPTFSSKNSVLRSNYAVTQVDNYILKI